MMPKKQKTFWTFATLRHHNGFGYFTGKRHPPPSDPDNHGTVIIAEHVNLSTRQNAHGSQVPH